MIKAAAVPPDGLAENVTAPSLNALALPASLRLRAGVSCIALFFSRASFPIRTIPRPIRTMVPPTMVGGPGIAAAPSRNPMTLDPAGQAHITRPYGSGPTPWTMKAMVACATTPMPIARKTIWGQYAPLIQSKSPGPPTSTTSTTTLSPRLSPRSVSPRRMGSASANGSAHVLHANWKLKMGTLGAVERTWLMHRPNEAAIRALPNATMSPPSVTTPSPASCTATAMPPTASATPKSSRSTGCSRLTTIEYKVRKMGGMPTAQSVECARDVILSEVERRLKEPTQEAPTPKRPPMSPSVARVVLRY
mmetsp:Transcript_33762/g.88835  ORF Transcript_33762/g.88835 Transcript_33762/m.88835 type:complete len:306 (-) Transcript_33762:148-1065(-)